MQKNGSFWKACLLLTFISVTGPLFATPADDAIALGQQKERAMDLDGALAAYNQAIALIPNNDDPANMASLGVVKVSREAVLMAKGGDEAFLAELVQDNAQNDANPLGLSDENLYAWIIQARKGQGQLANQQLSASLQKNASGMIQLPVVNATAKYFLGRMSEADLLAAARADDKRSVAGGKTNQSEQNALYYIGMKRLSAGDKAGALKKFQKANALKRRSLDTSTMVKAEINRLTATK